MQTCGFQGYGCISSAKIDQSPKYKKSSAKKFRRCLEWSFQRQICCFSAQNIDSAPKQSSAIFWHGRASGYVQEGRAGAIWMLAEHHLPPSEVGAVKETLSRLGYRSLVCPATKKDGGTHGGVMIGSKGHIALSPLHAAVLDLSRGGDLVVIGGRTRSFGSEVCQTRLRTARAFCGVSRMMWP